MCIFAACLAMAACSSSRGASKSTTKRTGTPAKTVSVPSAPTSAKAVDAKTQTAMKRYAKQMNVSVSSLENPKLYALLDEWLGVPYKYAGSSKKGTDCSGLVKSIYGKFTSKSLPRSSAELAKVINPAKMNKLQEGDLVFFNYDGKTNSHVGIYLQNGFFVHASSMKGVIISDLKSDYYKNRFSKGGPLRMGSLKELTDR